MQKHSFKSLNCFYNLWRTFNKLNFNIRLTLLFEKIKERKTLTIKSELDLRLCFQSDFSGHFKKPAPTRPRYISQRQAHAPSCNPIIVCQTNPLTHHNVRYMKYQGTKSTTHAVFSPFQMSACTLWFTVSGSCYCLIPLCVISLLWLYHLPTTYRPPTDHLPTTYRPLTDHVFTVQLVHN